MLGIIGAMDEEIFELRNKMKNVEVKKIAAFSFYIGKIEDVKIVLVKCFEGKINAAICTQIMIDNFNVISVINIGVAGGISKELSIGGIAISKNTVESDLDTSSLGYELGYAFGLNKVYIDCDEKIYSKLFEIASKKNNTVLGTIVSSDTFETNDTKKESLIKKFNAIATDMESASISHTCAVNNVSFCALRGVSDTGNEIEFREFVDMAIKKILAIILEYIKSEVAKI